MHRTNIYLTEEQCAALDRVARMRGTNRSDVVRDYVTQGLTIEFDGDDRVDRLLAAIDASFGAAPEIEMPDRSDAERDKYLRSIGS